MWKINTDWKQIIDIEMSKDYFKDIFEQVKKEYNSSKCYPNFDNILNCFNYFDQQELKVVLIGQDPYHQPNQAHGLSFSIEKEAITPSLKNIYKELDSDLGIKNTNPNLTKWAEQGVLLLNTILTVRESEPLSHKHIKWEVFTTNIIKYISEHLNQKIVFILLGNDAKEYKKYVRKENVLILETSHPSPLGAYRGFLGSKIFSKTNDYFVKNNIKSIDWKI